MENDDDLFDMSDKLESSLSGDCNEEENILSKCRGQKRRRLVSSFESENDVEDLLPIPSVTIMYVQV